jgi:hypothetical protein
MSAPFQPGDVVVYVGRSSHVGSKNPRPFEIGSVHRVTEVAHEAGWPAAAIMVPAATWWIYADCFRKIDDEQISEVLEALQRIKQKRPADAPRLNPNRHSRELAPAKQKMPVEVGE